MTMSTAIAADAGSRQTTTRSLLFEGARDMTPMVVGVVPFAIAIGAAVGASGLSRTEGLLSGPVILAGSAQLATVEMLDVGTAPFVIIFSAIMINARLLIYSASLAPSFAGHSLGSRLALAMPVVDQLHFVCVPRFDRGDLDLRGRTSYYIGAAVWLAGAFVTAQAVMVVIGANAPEALGLEVAAPLALVGLLAKSTTGRPSIVAAAAGFFVAVVAVGLPMHTSMLVATLVGIVAGVASMERGGEERS
jgi:predicted branched-subunit amino acid permease